MSGNTAQHNHLKVLSILHKINMNAFRGFKMNQFQEGIFGI